MSVKRGLLMAAIVAPVLAWLLYWLITPPAETAERLSIQLARAQTFSADVDLELAPRFSPDGTAVLFAQGTPRQTKIVMRDLSGNVITTIEKPGAVLLSPVWGPWSRKIYFWQQTADGCSIVERDVLNHTERQVVGCANQPQPRFDVYGDGKHIVVAWRARPEHPFGIARVNVADGTAEMLTSPQPGDGEDGLPRLSRDGTRMVFVRGGASHAKLWIMDPDNPSTARPLVSVEGQLYGVAWRGNHNDRLIAAADWPGFRALHLVDVATGNVDLIGARGARFPDSSTNGDIVYEAATYRADLWLANPDDPAQTPRDGRQPIAMREAATLIDLMFAPVASR